MSRNSTSAAGLASRRVSRGTQATNAAGSRKMFGQVRSPEATIAEPDDEGTPDPSTASRTRSASQDDAPAPTAGQVVTYRSALKPEAPQAIEVYATDSTRRAASAKAAVISRVHDVLDMGSLTFLSKPQIETEIETIVGEIVSTQNLGLSSIEEEILRREIVFDLLGLGPLEPLLNDPTVADILVNGPGCVYVERNGKLSGTDITFRDHQHLMLVAQRICAAVHRRVDESNPMVDARLADGSRVNVIIPPLALDGPFISIRKFAKRPISLDKMVQSGSMTRQMADVLAIAAACQLNIVISGGTGAGKTTLLNALSGFIHHGERIVTIEDAAELQLQQPHILRHETRPANIEGKGEVTTRDLVRNALRMRPDRIILGEARGPEAFDMLQAMNTGHEGSMCTIHANRPREALARLENMICMAGVSLPGRAIRQQICDAVNLIVQIKRCRDGVRRVVSITEVIGMEHDIITTQELFSYESRGMGANGRLDGNWRCLPIRPYFMPKAQEFDLGDTLFEAMVGEAPDRAAA